MNKIQKVIEESLKEFDKLAVYTNEYSYVHKIPKCDEVKSHLSTTISNILSAIEAEVEQSERIESKNPFPNIPGDSWRMGYNSALTDIQKLLKSANKQ